jgi:hypothetical protein
MPLPPLEGRGPLGPRPGDVEAEDAEAPSVSTDTQTEGVGTSDVAAPVSAKSSAAQPKAGAPAAGNASRSGDAEPTAIAGDAGLAFGLAGLGAETAAVENLLRFDALERLQWGTNLQRAFAAERPESAPGPRAAHALPEDSAASQATREDGAAPGDGAASLPNSGENRAVASQQQGIQVQREAIQASLQLEAAQSISQPVLAQIWSELYEIQEARLDRLTAMRLAEEEGRSPPEDEAEKAHKDRRIGAIHFGSMHARRQPAEARELTIPPAAPSSMAADAFAACLRGATLQNPQLILRMFAAAPAAPTKGAEAMAEAPPGVRLFAWRATARGTPRLVSIWEPLKAVGAVEGMVAAAAAAEAGWQDAALRVFLKQVVEANPVGEPPVVSAMCQAIEAISGSPATALSLSADGAKRIEQLEAMLPRANAPGCMPILLSRAPLAGNSRQMAAVVGLHREAKQQVVHLVWGAAAPGSVRAAEVRLAELAPQVEQLVMGRRIN